ncbi:very long-chain acyl-CoA synthetase-like isoform X1 [Gouania willdenowi]|uniref:long-chain-fatty-acid--CoA ligase n=1 Tax=Gouania willdenowi TaxID=441366 RepID=A0A8C5G7Z1_GOUWI|nr:very long-chain acyl-CoA synthetase-like isoform X1 [Gouania willdenowi]
MDMFPLLLGLVLAPVLTLLLFRGHALRLLVQDAVHALRLWRCRKALSTRMQRGVVSYLDSFLVQVDQNPDKVLLVYEDQVLTYRDVDRRSNRFARALRAQGSLCAGAVVGVLMVNEPDFLCVWLAVCKLGCEAAFINVSLRPKALLHCVRACGAHALIIGHDLVELVEEVQSELEDVSLLLVDHSSSSQRFITLLDKLETTSAEPLSELPTVDIFSNFVYIFTSGTTGLPKAAGVSHLKAVSSTVYLRMCGATCDDVVYVTLPLYHMSASLLGVGGCIHLGATCVLKKKFSASHFWKDCVEHRVTVVQYIGELCRYLLNHPVVPEEKSHMVRLVVGSGLRADVWKNFITRFGPLTIRESYGLTEINLGFLNYTDEVGPIGRSSFFNKLFMSFELLRYDPLTYQPLRTDSGRCIKARKGEAGLLVAPVTKMNQFMGYSGNKVQSEKKLLRNVLRDEDVYFNTGDLLMCDHRDFLYFRDRIGDTFRWKGENVSTTEVSEVLGLLAFIVEANVYGVSVPGCEGRAGMAAVVLKRGHTLDGHQLYKHLVETLPAYAWPRFLRLQSSIDVTDTFKQRKGTLTHEGFDPQLVPDPLYVLNVPQKMFTRITPALHQHILSGNMPL